MKKKMSVVLVSALALMLLLPAAAQAEVVVSNNNSSGASSSAAAAGGGGGGPGGGGGGSASASSSTNSSQQSTIVVDDGTTTVRHRSVCVDFVCDFDRFDKRRVVHRDRFFDGRDRDRRTVIIGDDNVVGDTVSDNFVCDSGLLGCLLAGSDISLEDVLSDLGLGLLGTGVGGDLTGDTTTSLLEGALDSLGL